MSNIPKLSIDITQGDWADEIGGFRRNQSSIPDTLDIEIRDWMYQLKKAEEHHKSNRSTLVRTS